MSLDREILKQIGFKVRGVIQEPVSQEERLLYELHQAIGQISEVVVEESKQHLSKDQALEKIRTILKTIYFD